jgi:hypothetical protein
VSVDFSHGDVDETEFSPDATDSIRLNFSQNHDAAVKAVDRIAQMVARYRSAR